MPKLTDVLIRNLKPQEKEIIIREPGGFVLKVSPRGTKSFLIIYDFQTRRRKLTLGKYPLVGLAEARKLFKKASRAKIDLGIDPGSEKNPLNCRSIRRMKNLLSATWLSFIIKNIVLPSSSVTSQ